MSACSRLGALAGLSLCLSACREQAPAVQVPPDGEIWLSKESMDKGQASLAEARERDMPQAIVTQGRIAFDEERVTHVFSPVTGRITRVLAPLGAHVKKGAPLLKLASPDAGTAWSDLVKARADLASARQEYERQRALWEAKAGSQRDLEAATDNFHKAEAEEHRARQKGRLLSPNAVDPVTQEYTLTSYLEGDVIARAVNPGAEVQGQYSGGAAVELFTIGDIAVVWAWADLAEADLPRVHEGDQVTLRVISQPGVPFRGRVELISTALDPALRTARVRMSFANPKKLLKPEMFAAIAIEQPARRQLAVPRKAVVQIGEQAFVFVSAGARPDGRAVFKRRRVTLSKERAHQLGARALASEVLPLLPPSAEEYLPIEQGLQAGEVVLIEGAGGQHQGGDEAALTEEQLRAADIQVTRVEPRGVKDALTIGGRLAFDDLRVAHVFSPVTGRVTRLLVGAGQRVKRGQPLAAIASPDLGAAFADLAKAKADLVVAEHELRRLRDLFAAEAAARRDLDLAEGNHAKAKAEYDRALHKTRLLGAGAGPSAREYLLRSPIDGMVVARGASPGVEVQGQYGGGAPAAELFTIGETDQLWLLGEIYEMDLAQVHQGQEVTFNVPGYRRGRFHGRIDWISDVLDPVMRTAKVRAVLDNPDGVLRPEMYREVTIDLSEEQVLAVPREALLRLGEQTVVLVAGEKDKEGRETFRRRRVIGNEEKPGGLVPVLDGLRAGESVVTKGAILLVGLLQ